MFLFLGFDLCVVVYVVCVSVCSVFLCVCKCLCPYSHVKANGRCLGVFSATLYSLEAWPFTAPGARLAASTPQKSPQCQRLQVHGKPYLHTGDSNLDPHTYTASTLTRYIIPLASEISFSRYCVYLFWGKVSCVLGGSQSSFQVLELEACVTVFGLKGAEIKSKALYRRGKHFTNWTPPLGLYCGLI